LRFLKDFGQNQYLDPLLERRLSFEFAGGKSPIDADAGSGLRDCHGTTLCIAQGPFPFGILSWLDCQNMNSDPNL